MRYNFKLYCYYHNPQLDAVSICRGYSFKEVFKEAYHICRRNFSLIQCIYVVLDNKEIIFTFRVNKFWIEVLYHRAKNARAYINHLKYFL